MLIVHVGITFRMMCKMTVMIMIILLREHAYEKCICENDEFFFFFFFFFFYLFLLKIEK